ncbi:MAG: hypothetical protein KY475_20730 [Planctomycetes bacterium]|nr:hypothetical protein [Planctomycetota bacterium]
MQNNPFAWSYAMFKRFQKVLFAGLMVLGLGAGSAQAGGYGYGYDDCYHDVQYRKVVTYVCREVPYTRCITLYDHCGHPYTVHKTFYKTVHVPVVKYVAYGYDDGYGY